MPGLRFANLIRDQEILEQAREEAQSLITAPTSPVEYEKALAWVDQNWRRRYGMVEAG